MIIATTSHHQHPADVGYGATEASGGVSCENFQSSAWPGQVSVSVESAAGRDGECGGSGLGLLQHHVQHQSRGYDNDNKNVQSEKRSNRNSDQTTVKYC